MFRNNPPEHKLAVIGDSISQGFNNGGIYRTDLNFPAFLSNCFGEPHAFDQPQFTAQAGIPLNLEVLVRGLSDKYGDTLEWNEYVPAARHLYSTLRRIKRYWEGRVKSLSVERDIPYHNQSVWGFAMNDAWMITQEMSSEYIRTHEETYSIFDILPEHAMYITAGMVLNPSFSKQFANFTQLENIRYLQEHGGIENLIVTMGHNNIIGSVTDLRFEYSEPADLDNPPHLRRHTVYRPEHFEQEFRRLAEQVSAIGAERVFTPTIPYVTIPPVSRGINEDLSRKEGKYFDYYTRFWIWDTDFDPDKHPHLTKEEAILLDQTVDEYNHIIRTVSREYGWIFVPLNKYVSAAARRRLAGEVRVQYPEPFIEAMERNPTTAHLVKDLERPGLSTDYIRLNEKTGKVRRGGIFSLDGIHPTTIGYGLMAHVYYDTMQRNGVNFNRELDWDFIIESDTLVTNPPYLLVELRELLRFLSLGRQEQITKLGKSILGQMMEVFSHRSWAKI